jgi:uncharacterized hydrophobic protein (TIGR00271 family)
MKADAIQRGQPVATFLSARSQEAILRTVREECQPTGVFWLMNALSSVIARYSLLANSAAVVIGAMFVAMLLGPISGVALGLNDGDRPLLRRALHTLVGGVVWIFAIAVLVGLVHRDVPLTGEILSRTDASLFDLIIALAGGAAGAVAVLSPRVGTAIVGVAVATALVPPLAAAGILVGRGDFDLAGGGALLLTLTNVIAIQLAFSLVFWFGGYRRVTSMGGVGFLVFLRRDLLSLGLVCALGVVFAIQLNHAVTASLFESRVRAELRHHLRDASGFHLVRVRIAKKNGDTLVDAVIRGPTAPLPAKVAEVRRISPHCRIARSRRCASVMCQLLS